MPLIATLFKSTVFRTDLLSRKGVYTPLLFSKTVFRTDLLPRKGVAVSTHFAMRNNSANPSYGGTGVIGGVVKQDFVPIKRKVRLYEAVTGALLIEMWTNDAGVYLFPGLRTDLRFTLTSTYGDGTYNDVISSNITAV